MNENKWKKLKISFLVYFNRITVSELSVCEREKRVKEKTVLSPLNFAI